MEIKMQMTKNVIYLRILCCLKNSSVNKIYIYRIIIFICVFISKFAAR